MSQLDYGERVLGISGYLLVGVAVLSFVVIVAMKLLAAVRGGGGAVLRLMV